MSDKLRFGEILVRAGVLERERLDEAMERVPEESDLGEYLVSKGLVDEGAMMQAISRALNLPTVSLADVHPDERALGLVPREFCVEYTLFPIELESTRAGDHLHVAMANPSDVRAIKQVTRKARRRIRPLVAPAREIRQAIARHYGGPVGTREAVSRDAPASRAPSLPGSSSSPVDMFDFSITDLSALDQHDAEGELGGGVDLGQAMTLDHLPALGDDVFETERRSVPRAPTLPERAPAPAAPAPAARGVALYSTPPPPAAPAPDMDVFEHSAELGSRRARPAVATDLSMFEHSGRLPATSRAAAPVPRSNPGMDLDLDPVRAPAPTSRPPRPGPPVSLGPLPGAPVSGPPRPMVTSGPPRVSTMNTPSPTLRSPPRPASEAPGSAAADPGGMMIRKRRRGDASEEPESRPDRASVPARPTIPDGKAFGTPTPADGIDMRRLFDRIEARDEELAAGDAVIARYLDRYGQTPSAPPADEFLGALERALGRAGSPTSRLLLLLVRRLSQSGLIDPADLLAELQRK